MSFPNFLGGAKESALPCAGPAGNDPDSSGCFGNMVESGRLLRGKAKALADGFRICFGREVKRHFPFMHEVARLKRCLLKLQDLFCGPVVRPRRGAFQERQTLVSGAVAPGFQRFLSLRVLGPGPPRLLPE